MPFFLGFQLFSMYFPSSVRFRFKLFYVLFSQGAIRNSITKLVLFLFINIGKVLGGIFITGKSKSIFKKNFIQEGPEELE
jgi:hypothetical protein